MKAPAALPDGRRVYAIGDVHGCAERLRRLHDHIAQDIQNRPVPRAIVVHLGDYVDRGPDSAGAVAELLRPWPDPSPAVVNLMGNHEAMMLGALDGDPASIELWLPNGGTQALRSWGAAWNTPSRSWAATVPPPHLTLLRGLARSYQDGGYMFVHAGVRPGIALDQQSPDDLIWIREPFLSWRKPLGGVIVHGHTPRPHPEVLPTRIGIDTGAVYGGKLTCLVLEHDRLGFLQS